MDAIRPDYAILQFRTYAEYLKSFISVDDQRYIQNTRATRFLVKLGYRSNSYIYEEDEFKKIKEKTVEMLNPKIKTNMMCGNVVREDDSALKALAEREKPNLLQKISTIIFLLVRQPSGFDVSGYMDYASSLRHFALNMRGATDWKSIFEGKVQLRPKSSDLSYYDMHKKIVNHNDSENYQTMHIGRSIMFMHKGDHKIIHVDSRPSLFPANCKRTMFHSPRMGTIVLYDHIVRKPV